MSPTSPTEATPASNQLSSSGASIQSPKPGVYTTQFWVSILVILSICALTAYGKIPGEFSAIGLAVVAGAYHWLRKETYAELTINPNDHLAGLVGEVMEHLPEATPAEVADIICALKTGTLPPFPTLAQGEAGSNQSSVLSAQSPSAAPTSSTPPGSGAGVGPKLSIIVLALGSWLFLAGCAGTKVSEGGSDVLHTQMNADEVEFRTPKGTYLHVVKMDHSTPTLAGGHASSEMIRAAFNGLTKALLAYMGGPAAGSPAAAANVASKAAALGALMSDKPAAAPSTPKPALPRSSLFKTQRRRGAEIAENLGEVTFRTARSGPPTRDAGLTGGSLLAVEIMHVQSGLIPAKSGDRATCRAKSGGSRFPLRDLCASASLRFNLPIFEPVIDVDLSEYLLSPLEVIIIEIERGPDIDLTRFERIEA